MPAVVITRGIVAASSCLLVPSYIVRRGEKKMPSKVVPSGILKIVC
jgi:hypothetical protein